MSRVFVSPLATPFHLLVSIFPIPSRYISIFHAPSPRYFSPSLSQRQLRLPARPPAGRAGPAVLSAVECRAAARRRAVGAPAQRLPLRPGAVRALHPCPLSGAPAQHAEGPRVPRAPARQLAATGAVPSAVTLRLRVERIRSDCRKNLCYQAIALWFGKCPAGL